MATTYTGLLQLPKHDTTDPFDITLINNMADLVDAGVAKAYRGKAAHNLLDNSDFCAERYIAQAGIRAYHGNTLYLGDRWVCNPSITTATQQEGGVFLNSSSAQYAYIDQKVRVEAGKRYTFAVYATDISGTHRIATYNSNNSVIYTQDYANNRELLITTFTAGENVVSMLYYPGYESGGGSAVIRWAALYEGSYTAETLPGYQPKGYAAELAECQRYYRRFDEVAFGFFTSENGVQVEMPLNPPMRVAPTVTNIANPTAYTVNGKVDVSGSYASVASKTKAGYIYYSPTAAPIGTPAVVSGMIAELSADL